MGVSRLAPGGGRPQASGTREEGQGVSVARVMADNGSTPAAISNSPMADKVRAANERFNEVSSAVAAGYAPIPCASGQNGGAMGIHYVNGSYLKDDDVVDIGRPEAVMYESMPDGSLKLVAVEYITFKGPASLEGQLFNFISAPNRYGLDPCYELHVWAWKPNRHGTFADMNPDVFVRGREAIAAASEVGPIAD